jgi:hypothetical protein
VAVVSNVEIRVDARNAIKQLDLIQCKSSKLPAQFQKGAVASKGLAGGLATAGTAAKGLGAALSAALGPLLAIGAAVGAVTKSFTVMGERQADIAALENGLKNLGVTGDQVLTALQTKADEFGKVTLFSQEDYTRAATQLTSFTNISVSAFDRVINVAGDVAQVMNQDVNSAVTQLAKALNAPTQNLSALSRSGIQFTEQQKEQIKALEASGQLQAAQGLILAELERQYQGAAIAAGSAGLAGALDGLAEVANDAFEAFGKMLEPIAVPIIQGITKYVQFMSDTWAYISGVIFPEIVAAAKPLTDALGRVFSGVDIEGFGTVLQNIVIAGFKVLTTVIGGVSKVLGFVIDRFVDLSNNPVFKFIAEQVGRLANQLGLTTDRVGEFNDAQKMSQAEADKILAKQTQVTSAADDTNASQKQINETLKQQTALLDQAARGQTKALTDNLSLAEARYGTEKQLLSNQIQQAQAAGNSNKVYRLKVKLAELDYDIAVQRIKAEVRKLEIAKQLAKAKVKELEVAVLQTAEGSKEEARLKRAVALQLEAVKQATANLSRGKELAKEQIKGAAAVKAGAIAAAKAERSAAANAKSTRAAAQASGQYADNMQRGANAASRAASSLSRLTGGLGQKSKAYTTTGTISIKGASQQAIAQAGGLEQFNQASYLRSGFRSALSQWNQFADKVLTIDRQLSASGATRTPAYASGGYVSSPTNAMIGEGGSEYVIPASKMSAAMERYAAGKRGDAVVPNGNDTQVNVSTGPVMQMNGQNYVTQSDFEKGLRSTVNQVMTTLRRSPNTRAAVGI